LSKRLLSAAVLAATLALPGAASAWPQSCCLPWGTPGQVVVSPDGTSAYAADANTALWFARDPASGALTLRDGYDGGGKSAAAISADGRSVYFAHENAVAMHENTPAISIYRRDATGALAPAGESHAAGARVDDLATSPDGRELYATSSGAGVVSILDRDPATGALSRRGGVTGLDYPSGMDLSDDGAFLYVATRTGIVVFARAGDGSLTQVQSTGVMYGSAVDIELSPDGTRLYAGPIGPTTFDRDPSTGQLGTPRSSGVVGEGGGGPSDGALAVAPDSSAVYLADNWSARLYQLARTDEGLALAKTYREPGDGQGLRHVETIASSPDGASFYVTSPAESAQSGGRIATFHRRDGDDVLVFGSLFDGPMMNGVPPWEQRPPTVTINSGAIYTNDPHVTLTVANLNTSMTMDLLISNDGGFGPGTKTFKLQRSGRYEWTLATSGPERLPKTVYVRPRGFGVGTVLTDDIVLDERPPVLVAVRQAGKRLRIRARDRLSGVGRMQVAHSRRHPGRWRRYRSSTRYSATRGRAWVRVRDRAGNRSHWRRAAIRRHG
jgi:DNA-binding beta-propeller fold protein YncE